MKLDQSFTLLAILILAGCKPSSPPKQSPPYRPLQNGFGVAAKWIGVDSGPGASLYYKGTNEIPQLVWPHIGTRGYPILYSNDVALLMADKPDEEGRLGGGALIAVQGTGPAMDISKDIIQLYASRSNADFSLLLRTGYHPLELVQSNEQMTVAYLPWMQFRDKGDLVFPITWNDVFSVMEDVKRTGRTNKVVNTDVLYLQKDYGGAGR